MAIGAILSAGASILGGLFSANQADKAAKAQTEAANRQIDLYGQMYQDQNNALAPYRQGGQTAYNAYLYEMGLGAAPTVGGTPAAITCLLYTSDAADD